MTRPLFISEVSSNHHRDLQRCFNFIDRSADIGCWGVKFQLFHIDELFAPEILAKSELHRRRRDWELPEEYIPQLARHCRQRGIAFGCTPFHLQAVDVLAPHVDFFKIASYELLWTELLQSCAATGKPVILSTGMATMDEITGAVKTLRDAGCSDLTLLHCVSSYPSPAAECNLAALDTLRRAFDCKVGWSDHSVSPAVINRAVNRWQASMIEFHLDLDGQGEEFAAGHCWLPEPMEKVIRDMEQGLCADGDGDKKPVASELPDREWRADPSDGLRPFKHMRKGFGND
ncbi:N-acetylneuraminate synthase family protein [Syntrophotalea carbinolica DSM 2380]|uniref:N-acetylneuraminate synthase family protein n=1 Tax=Syntrophotalea carbinolica (strain DSM 2380 / NBRC 103641 / GraBd1) TaxID=338963 RepID=Q3A5G8_SYNC1|nr:N-acetylneuraminate synthase family protein [Syntrophotalea carbinolica]ABA88389.1 N-acetylneuraminate synthase family protein [Syntrophotalea carbinolica DSM 2380]